MTALGQDIMSTAGPLLANVWVSYGHTACSGPVLANHVLALCWRLMFWPCAGEPCSGPVLANYVWASYGHTACSGLLLANHVWASCGHTGKPIWRRIRGAVHRRHWAMENGTFRARTLPGLLCYVGAYFRWYLLQN